MVNVNVLPEHVTENNNDEFYFIFNGLNFNLYNDFQNILIVIFAFIFAHFISNQMYSILPELLDLFITTEKFK